ncbi:hypothetical protein T11_3521 [Trichinella zimbabwensis]|uniref:Uncharacterized protein n=1 Tax=Trichinella zimbabwensis TaxID=268475 RepID=A0A0V1GJX7_9BILA|nr:hypothetical protein T11_3521 [Trichinella zimbabwensis]
MKTLTAFNRKIKDKLILPASCSEKYRKFHQKLPSSCGINDFKICHIDYFETWESCPFFLVNLEK